VTAVVLIPKVEDLAVPHLVLSGGDRLQCRSVCSFPWLAGDDELGAVVALGAAIWLG
jgi:hypothetical protein